MPLTLKQHRGDILGDGWAHGIHRVWELMKAADPELTSVPGAYALWQWAQCELAGLPGRCVASPQAMAICGKPCPMGRLHDLLALSDRVITDLTTPKPERPARTENQLTLDLED